MIYTFFIYDHSFRNSKRALNKSSVYYGHLKEQLSKTTKLFSILEVNKPVNKV